MTSVLGGPLRGTLYEEGCVNAFIDLVRVPKKSLSILRTSHMSGPSLSVSVALVRLELPDVLVAGVPPARPPELPEALLHTVDVVPLEPVAKFASQKLIRNPSFEKEPRDPRNLAESFWVVIEQVASHN